MIVKKAGFLKQDALYIGDMAIDAETTERAGIDFIFITGGSSNLSDVKKYKNKNVIYSLRQLL